MAIACCTNEWRGQKLDDHDISTLQGKLLTLDKEKNYHIRGYLSLSSFPHFIFLPQNLSPPLGNYKRGGRDMHLRRMKKKATDTHLAKTTHTHTHTPHTPPRRDLGSVLSLESL
jgi:hypothetical protein